MRKMTRPISASAAALLAAGLLLVAGCGGSRTVTKEDYDSIKKGMTQQEVEAKLGKGQATTADKVPSPELPGMMRPGADAGSKNKMLEALTLVQWGSGDDNRIVCGFSKSGKVQVKASKIGGATAYETLGTISFGPGGVEFKD